MTERGLTNHDHPIEHLLWDRAHNPCAVRVHMRTPGWQDECFYTAALEQAIERLGACGVAIMDEIAFPEEAPVERIGQLPLTSAFCSCRCSLGGLRCYHLSSLPCSPSSPLSSDHRPHYASKISHYGIRLPCTNRRSIAHDSARLI